MAYVNPNFRTKKSLKEALARKDYITVWQPGPFWDGLLDGTVYLEGPHYPEPHRWYAVGQVEKGQLIAVK